MKDGQKTVRWHKRKPTATPDVRSQAFSARPTHPSAPNARRNYERYLELARAEAVAGNPVGAENFISTPNIISDQCARPLKTDNNE